MREVRARVQVVGGVAEVGALPRVVGALVGEEEVEALAAGVARVLWRRRGDVLR